MSKKKYYEVYSDISQDFGLRITPMKKKNDYHTGYVICDDGGLAKKLKKGRDELDKLINKLVERCHEKALDPQPKWFSWSE